MSRPVDGVDPYVPERGNAGYRAVHYDLDLTYKVTSNLLEGRATTTIVALDDLDRIVFDLVGLRVTAAKVAGRAARWKQSAGKLTVTPAAPVVQGDEVTLELRYRGNPGLTRSSWGPVGWELLEDGVLVAAQPSGACTWFPCNDLASQKATFSVSVTTATPYRVLANGTLRSTSVRAGSTTWVYDQVEPTSPYLMSLHIGRYDDRVLADGPVPVRAVLSPEDADAFADAFDRQTEMVACFVELFGPYPFEAGYTVVVCPDDLEVPVEAMGQAAFGRNHLDGRNERLIAHELSHQWFGNSLTASRWSDIWLHEGFACYAEWLWSERSGDRSADQIARTKHAKLSQLPQDLLLGDPGPVDLFDDRVYKRGALTLHALRLEIGDAAFFDLLLRWCAQGRHGSVSTDEFEDLAAEVAGRPLGDLFDRWLRATVLPELPAVTDS